MSNYVIVDWRPGYIPLIYGTFVTRKVGLEYALEKFSERELDDGGIDIVPIQDIGITNAN